MMSGYCVVFQTVYYITCTEKVNFCSPVFARDDRGDVDFLDDSTAGVPSFTRDTCFKLRSILDGGVPEKYVIRIDGTVFSFI